MNWLTLKQVGAAVKRGRKASLKCSYKHWYQISTATIEEFRDIADIRAVFSLVFYCLINENYCAMCQRYKCSKCLLYSDEGCCFGEWERVNNWLQNQLKIDASNLKEFRKLARRVRNKIGKVYEDLYNEKL